MSVAGDNSKMTDADRQILFASHFREDMSIEGQMRALRTQRKANRQLAKAAGFPSSKIDHYLKAFYGEDDQKPVDKLMSDKENLIWLGLIHEDSKGDLLADRVSSEQLLRAKGFKAGLLNLEKVSGYDAGSADDKLWRESYEAGKKEYDTKLPDLQARIKSASSKEEPPAKGDDPFGTTDDALAWAKASPDSPSH